MKYNEINKPITCMMTHSTCYNNTTPMTVKGILIHSTGANNPNIKRYVQPSDNAIDRAKMLQLIGTNTYQNDWNHIVHNAGVNAFIGKLADGTIATVQTMPWNYRPWGCGSGVKGSCNNSWLQFEICEDSLNDVNYFNAIYQEMIELIAYLCKMFNLNPLGVTNCGSVANVPVILCHQDSYRLGLGSNHGDILHWFPKFGKTLQDIRNDVYNLLNQPNEEEEEEVTQEQFNEMMDNYLAKLANEPATWEQSDANWGQQNGLLVGDATGNLMTKKFITRGEFISVLHRYNKKFGK